jgi:hypothetical protein
VLNKKLFRTIANCAFSADVTGAISKTVVRAEIEAAIDGIIAEFRKFANTVTPLAAQVN